VTIAREGSNSPEGAKKAIHLTVKMPSNKLREATSNGRVGTRDGLEPADIITGPRSNRGRKSYVVESESDDEEEEEEEEEEEAEDDIPVEDQIGEPEATDDDIDADENDEEEPEQDEAADEDEAESGSGEEDEEVEMEDETPMPPPPVIGMTGPASKPRVTVTPAQSGKLKGVEEREMEGEEDDEDLSSINSEGEDDAEGEEIGDVDEMDQDEEGDIQSTGVGSRASTPDVSKMTKRQKSRLSEVMGNDFLQLPMGKCRHLIPCSSRFFSSQLPPAHSPSITNLGYQNHKSRSISPPKNTPCVVPKWLVAARTSARSAMKKRKRTLSTVYSRNKPRNAAARSHKPKLLPILRQVWTLHFRKSLRSRTLTQCS